jgi:hypothetical protein
MDVEDSTGQTEVGGRAVRHPRLPLAENRDLLVRQVHPVCHNRPVCHQPCPVIYLKKRKRISQKKKKERKKKKKRREDGNNKT